MLMSLSICRIARTEIGHQQTTVGRLFRQNATSCVFSHSDRYVCLSCYVLQPNSARQAYSVYRSTMCGRHFDWYHFRLLVPSLCPKRRGGHIFRVKLWPNKYTKNKYSVHSPAKTFVQHIGGLRPTTCGLFLFQEDRICLTKSVQT